MKKKRDVVKKIKKRSWNSNDKKILLIPLRYIILLGLVLSLPLIYKILTPLTIYPVSLILKMFFSDVVTVSNFLIINLKVTIELIDACVAGSAYLLLLILNLSLEMPLKKRIYSIIFSLMLLYIINIIRIVIFSILFYNSFEYFDFTHKLFWYFISTIFIVGIWFLTIKIFKIKEIPVYSDVMVLLKEIKRKQ